MGPDRRRERAQVLRPVEAAERIRIGRAEPPAALTGPVDYLWWVEWDAPTPHVQHVLPRPVVHLAAERLGGEARLLVHGVPTARFERTLRGRDRTVAVALRPGGLRAFTARPAAELTDRVVPAGELFGADDRALARHLLDPHVDPEEAADELATWMTARCGPVDPSVPEVAELVERVERDRSITRAEQLAALAGTSLRTLQRRFRTHVGVTPKWVVQRYRLMDVLEEAHGPTPVDWAEVAARLGYADQSHLIRHFTALVGESPARYLAGDRAGPPG